MEVSLDDFRRHFELLSDETLLSTNREELTEGGRQCYDEEVARRGLLNPAPAEEVAEEAHETSPAEELVVIATYLIPDEANLARGLLQSAEIPFRMENELAPLGGFQLRLLVPRAFEEEALAVLDSEISEEELAAQAEAAGAMEEEAEEESDEV
jgi:Putative prokaryotic signal transducing protein